MKVVEIGEEILREKATEVSVFDQSLKKTIEEMFVLMKKKSGVGLAAPQVGISKRFFVLQEPGGTPMVFINPEIIETSLEMSEFEEGCLSVPGVWGAVSRPESIRIQAQDATGRLFRLSLQGYLARIFQHEFDHLNGVLFVDHLSPQDLAKYQKKFKKWGISFS